MARVCEDCKILEKYTYWNELPSIKHRFFKIMLGDFKHQLFIPVKFTEYFKGEELLGIWTLIGPSGNKWSVKLSSSEEDHNRVVFLNGWEKFVRDHSIGSADFLAFSYIGSSSFRVLIFDATGCEREESHFATNKSTSHATCISTLHVGLATATLSETYVEEGVRSSERKEKNPSIEEDEFKFEDSKSSETRDTTQDSSTEEEGLNKMPNKSRNRRSARAKVPQMHYISNRRKLTRGEINRASMKADAHQSKTGISVVRITMKRTHVYKGFHMTIPKKWADEHMLHEPHQVKLKVQPGGQSWKVGCRWNKSAQCQLGVNWPKFVFDNTLEEHDICIFELIKKREPHIDRIPVFQVYIYRVIDEPSRLTVATQMV